jgi:hypothetical protein
MIEEPNPYAPPATAEDLGPPPQPMTESEEDPYYVVPIPKLVVLSLASFGFFEVYWLYRQWKAVAARTRKNVSPFWRAFFSLWFVNRLFVQIRMDSAAAGVQAQMSTGVLAAIYIIASLIGNGASNYNGTGAAPLFLISYLAVIPLAIVQQEINRYQARVSPELDGNTRWGAGPIITVVLGTIVWGLTIVGWVAPQK